MTTGASGDLFPEAPHNFPAPATAARAQNQETGPCKYLLRFSHKHTPKNRLLSLLVCTHLLLVTLNAAHLSPASHQHLLGRLLYLYGAFTGANNFYGLFAPSIASQITATYRIRDPQGRTSTHRLEENRLHSEYNFRMSTVYHFLPYPRPKIYWLIAAQLPCWATTPLPPTSRCACTRMTSRQCPLTGPTRVPPGGPGYRKNLPIQPQHSRYPDRRPPTASLCAFPLTGSSALPA
jgi:hypothetical protein